jgi:hypothetical protein
MFCPVPLFTLAVTVKFRQKMIAEINTHSWFWFEVCDTHAEKMLKSLNKSEICQPTTATFTPAERAKQLLFQLRLNPEVTVDQFMLIVNCLSKNGDKSQIVSKLLDASRPPDG